MPHTHHNNKDNSAVNIKSQFILELSVSLPENFVTFCTSTLKHYGTTCSSFLEDDVHRLRGRQHLDYLHGPTRSRRSRSCSPPRSSRRLAGFQSSEGYGTNISAALAETKNPVMLMVTGWAPKGLRSHWMEWTMV